MEIWEYARSHDLLIVTFDEDYSNIYTLRGAPPKIIWLRFGNNTTSFIAEKLEQHRQDINELRENPELGLLEIY